MRVRKNILVRAYHAKATTANEEPPKGKQECTAKRKTVHQTTLGDALTSGELFWGNTSSRAMPSSVLSTTHRLTSRFCTRWWRRIKVQAGHQIVSGAHHVWCIQTSQESRPDLKPSQIRSGHLKSCSGKPVSSAVFALNGWNDLLCT